MARHVRRSPEKLPANRAVMEKFELCMCVCVIYSVAIYTGRRQGQVVTCADCRGVDAGRPIGDHRKIQQRCEIV